LSRFAVTAFRDGVKLIWKNMEDVTMPLSPMRLWARFWAAKPSFLLAVAAFFAKMLPMGVKTVLCAVAIALARRYGRF
jgi:hypothetical protein